MQFPLLVASLNEIPSKHHIGRNGTNPKDRTQAFQIATHKTTAQHKRRNKVAFCFCCIIGCCLLAELKRSLFKLLKSRFPRGLQPSAREQKGHSIAAVAAA